MVPVKNETSLPLGIVTMADALRSAGYATGCFGKWHLGEGPQHLPQRRGFDVVVMRDEPDKHPATDFLTDEAAKFIRKHAGQPFFAYVSYHAVHVPLRAPQPLIDKYKAKTPVNGHHDPTYAAMLEKLDTGVGRILATLDELKLADKTLVIFCSDNGGVGGYERAGVRGAHDITDNTPLRGGKGMLYEGGIRIPMIARWPGIIEPGATCDEPVATIDFYPTFLELSQCSGSAKQALDGVSLVALFKSSGKSRLAERALFWHFPGYLQASETDGTWRTTPAGAIRRGDYKLIEFFETGKIEMYNLRDDLSETRDLAASQPEQAAKLHGELVAWRESVNARMPKFVAQSRK
jgi:arylsulfatase A-like enzyme